MHRIGQDRIGIIHSCFLACYIITEYLEYQYHRVIEYTVEYIFRSGRKPRLWSQNLRVSQFHYLLTVSLGKKKKKTSKTLSASSSLPYNEIKIGPPHRDRAVLNEFIHVQCLKQCLVFGTGFKSANFVIVVVKNKLTVVWIPENF